MTKQPNNYYYFIFIYFFFNLVLWIMNYDCFIIDAKTDHRLRLYLSGAAKTT